jgi:diguanylate cyclase (GGDEF)-like protein/PAS domain S-box-containing protein
LPEFENHQSQLLSEVADRNDLMTGTAATTNELDPVAKLAMDRSWLRASVLVDSDLIVRWVSPSMELLLGWAPSQIVGTPAFEFVHPDDHTTAVETLAFESIVDPSNRSAHRRRNVREVRFRTPDGTYVPLETALTNFYDDPDIGMLLVDLAASTQFRQVTKAIELGRMGAELAEILAVVLTQFTSSDPGQPAAAIFDKAGGLLVATANAPVPYGPEQLGAYRDVWKRELLDPASGEAVGSARFWCQPNTPNPFDIDASVLVGRQAAIALANHSATEELQRAALRDPLTGLGNRRALDQDLRTRLENGDDVLLVYLDLDGFKAVNDRLGHAAGDEVLKVVAARLTSSLRTSDLAARLGGDEFVLVVGPSAPPAAVISDRLAMVMSAPILVHGEAVQVSFSVGFGSGLTDADALLSLADRAMLASKHRR